MMNRFLCLVLCGTLAVSACTGLERDLEKSNPPRSLNLTAKQLEYVEAGNRFSLKYMYAVAQQQAGSWFVSPLGVQMLLGMMLNGADGETAEQIYEVLGYGKDELSEVNAYVKTLLEQLPEMDSWSEMDLAQAAFINERATIHPPFKDVISDCYQADVTSLDFSKSSSIRRVNDWCSRETSGHISEILDETLKDRKLAAFMSAGYFHGAWREAFPRAETVRETFYLENGRERQVPMMKISGKPFRWGSGGSTEKRMQIPFGNQSLVMTIILADRGYPLIKIIDLLAYNDIIHVNLGYFDPSPNAKELQERVAYWKNLPKTLDTYEIDLWLPKFETETNIDLRAVLSDMGMPLAFLPASDYKGVSPNGGTVDAVRQKACIKVDESGKTGLETVLPEPIYGYPVEEMPFHCTNPFVYIISEASTNLILFAGAYMGE